MSFTNKGFTKNHVVALATHHKDITIDTSPQKNGSPDFSVILIFSALSSEIISLSAIDKFRTSVYWIPPRIAHVRDIEIFFISSASFSKRST